MQQRCARSCSCQMLEPSFVVAPESLIGRPEFESHPTRRDRVFDHLGQEVGVLITGHHCLAVPHTAGHPEG